MKRKKLTAYGLLERILDDLKRIFLLADLLITAEANPVVRDWQDITVFYLTIY